MMYPWEVEVRTFNGVRHVLGGAVRIYQQPKDGDHKPVKTTTGTRTFQFVDGTEGMPSKSHLPRVQIGLTLTETLANLRDAIVASDFDVVPRLTTEFSGYLFLELWVPQFSAGASALPIGPLSLSFEAQPQGGDYQTIMHPTKEREVPIIFQFVEQRRMIPPFREGQPVIQVQIGRDVRETVENFSIAIGRSRLCVTTRITGGHGSSGCAIEITRVPETPGSTISTRQEFDEQLTALKSAIEDGPHAPLMRQDDRECLTCGEQCEHANHQDEYGQIETIDPDTMPDHPIHRELAWSNVYCGAAYAFGVLCARNNGVQDARFGQMLEGVTEAQRALLISVHEEAVESYQEDLETFQEHGPTAAAVQTLSEAAVKASRRTTGNSELDASPEGGALGQEVPGGDQTPKSPQPGQFWLRVQKLPYRPWFIVDVTATRVRCHDYSSAVDYTRISMEQWRAWVASGELIRIYRNETERDAAEEERAGSSPSVSATKAPRETPLTRVDDTEEMALLDDSCPPAPTKLTREQFLRTVPKELADLLPWPAPPLKTAGTPKILDLLGGRSTYTIDDRQGRVVTFRVGGNVPPSDSSVIPCVRASTLSETRENLKTAILQSGLHVHIGQLPYGLEVTPIVYPEKRPEAEGQTVPQFNSKSRAAMSGVVSREYDRILRECTEGQTVPRSTTGRQPGSQDDPLVNHPRHYNAHPSGIECIDVIEHMEFNVGTAVKYLWRLGHKTPDRIRDLEKALWYIERQLKRERDGQAS